MVKSRSNSFIPTYQLKIGLAQEAQETLHLFFFKIFLFCRKNFRKTTRDLEFKAEKPYSVFSSLCCYDKSFFSSTAFPDLL
jgi:hypothetical protein